ncbi:TPA: sugar transferase [Clostridium perfringens]|nr:sugar transferase [Clostridium perfringens]HAT4284981.1 sugar transferase [Clostridium perfringens]
MYNKYFKRVIDIIIALIGLPFFVVIYIVIGTLIKLDDKGPIFYIDRRIGRNSEIINMYKFRSMKVNSPDIRNNDGSTFNSKDDPRLTRLGRFLRETSIDETPQLLNVLKGNMSIIGPRASLESDLETFKDDEKDKMLVRPGISGYTQAYYRNGLNVREKRIKDAWYANNVSFILDIRIFFKTIITVLKRENLYTNSDS